MNKMKINNEIWKSKRNRREKKMKLVAMMITSKKKKKKKKRKKNKVKKNEDEPRSDWREPHLLSPGSEKVKLSRQLEHAS